MIWSASVEEKRKRFEKSQVLEQKNKNTTFAFAQVSSYMNQTLLFFIFLIKLKLTVFFMSLKLSCVLL